MGSGLQNNAYGLILNFSSETREFVQILYRANQWNVMSREILSGLFPSPVLIPDGS